MTRGISFIPNKSCGPCLYCCGISDGKPEEFLSCDTCKRSVHFKCLMSGVPQYRLLGDNFFNFGCLQCNPKGEIIFRAKLSFNQVFLLVLYNLHFTQPSNDGYFHYKKDIYNFIMNNWKELYSYNGHNLYKERSKIPASCISGQLSQCAMFQPKREERGRRGWYRMCTLAAPTVVFHANLARRKADRNADPDHLNIKPCVFLPPSPTHSAVSNASKNGDELVKDDSSDSVDDSSRGSWFTERDILKPTARLPQNIFEGQEEVLDIEEIPIPVAPPPSPVSLASWEPRVVSLFNSNVEETIAGAETEKQTTDENLFPLSLYEERKLLRKLDSCSSALSPRRYLLRRKLKVRQLKREHNLPVFDLDEEMRFYKCNSRMKTSTERKLSSRHGFESEHSQSHTRILDRFQIADKISSRARAQCAVSFHVRLSGNLGLQPQLIHSPFTLRSLKPFIFRDHSTTTPKMTLLQEIVSYATRRNRLPDLPSKSLTKRSIDYCYVTPKHIPAMNHLAIQFFWPGIDLSEVLHYPDFTCVVLYGQLVIGFGILVPDVSASEAYVSMLLVHPEWRRAGVAKMILYHLIQTCPGKDVTLHVSATNPAMILYQKFGFKVEEFLANFYDKYLPVDSPECKHAMFLRLRR